MSELVIDVVVSSLAIVAAALLAAGTLTTAVDVMTDQPRRLFSAAGELMWCAAGTLAIGGAAAGVTRLALGAFSGSSFGALVLSVIVEVVIVLASALLLRLYGFWSRLRQLVETRRHQQRDVER